MTVDATDREERIATPPGGGLPPSVDLDGSKASRGALDAESGKWSRSP